MPLDNESVKKWTINQLKTYLRASGAGVSRKRGDLLDR